MTGPGPKRDEAAAAAPAGGSAPPGVNPRGDGGRASAKGAGTQGASGGLTSAEARSRLATHGPNALPDGVPLPAWKRFVKQFQSPLIYILLFAFVFDVGSWIHDGLAGVPVEAIAIGAVLLLNALLGTIQELRSEQALAQLKAMAAPQAWVLRDGHLVHVPSSQLVPGDVVRMEAGERIPADGRLTEALGVMVDESVLTGESVPVDKAHGHELFSGTLAVRGKGFFEITATGARSTMGKLATMLGTVVAEKTPLEKRLGKLGNQLARWVGGLALLLAVGGVLVEGLSRLEHVVLFAVALAVAAVPEGMPAVVTLTLAMGVQRMAKRNAVVRRLSAVEALGSVTVIATDKTGTLTENRMRVHGLEAVDGPEALAAMVLANDADDTEQAGDPLELGLIEHARSAGIDVPGLRARCRRLDNRPFDSAWKYMRVTVDDGTGARSYLKGAPEVLLDRCEFPEGEHARWAARAEAAASEGYRVLALARGEGNTEKGLRLLGLVLLWDPPRAEVPEAIRKAQRAGVRVLMITGDHPGTARAVAKSIGIEHSSVLTGDALDKLSAEELPRALKQTSVFARVSPEHKLKLVDALKASGEVVAMTGDGVNDAPALKRSDVGVAMGQRGSDVAREVADLVLLDDNFATIVNAIEEGRSIYENIQTFIRFTFSTNVALVLLVVIGTVGSYVENLRTATGALLLPLTALHLLWINFLGDGPPALALALDRNAQVMEKPPRAPTSPLLDAPSLRFILATGVTGGVAGLFLLLSAPMFGLSLLAAQTIVFLQQSIGKLLSAYPARRVGNAPRTNHVLHALIGGGIALQAATVTVPALRNALGLEAVNARMLSYVVGAVAIHFAVAFLASRLFSPRVAPRSPGDAGRANPLPAATG
ncbi:MAG TPA: cation-transporting P-type ATPase [Myxococcaceae bacterium]|nr:cation-transporting P-type ATPase [Myxococcaceae bacterium]